MAALFVEGNYALLALAIDPEVATRVEELREAEDERARTDR